MSFINNDFLLTTSHARELYHGFAEDEPIIDYHCHLSPALIASNHRFGDLAEAWARRGITISGAPMRANGVDERLCTGSAAPWEKILGVG